MKGPEISIQTSCMTCSHVVSKEPAVDDLFDCSAIDKRVNISPYSKTPKECPYIIDAFRLAAKKHGVNL